MATFKSGPGHGLTLTKNSLFNLNTNYANQLDGMIVFVHNSSSRPSESQSVFLKAGEMSYITVRRTHLIKYPWPYSDCTALASFSTDLRDFITSETNATYRQEDCLELCLQREIVQVCKCYFLKYLRISRFDEPCLNLSQLECVNVQSKHASVGECAARSCPLECESVTYDVGVSSATKPTVNYFNNLPAEYKYYYQEYLTLLNQSLTYELFKSLYVSMNVYYPSLQYTQISETPKTSMSDLLSQVGGSLGMFISFSVFTFFELVEVACLIVHSFVFGKRFVSNSIHNIS